ncbi:hypothetical protein E6C76_12370 [Pseudothauera nasutitermitis]|uniref:Uncharacterized protein n=1 Tax=Pseudothauera nasutitermitis TaxID=2565930 RepID=A0A4S4AYG3_9RHOO|nr:hypothetical protein [Pseudothauera nasutitermitis]THF65010.1 hypothetical protein E6C76_12370 [Pseudothauera nasutitermitis]
MTAAAIRLKLPQQRVTLKNLKVAEFASEETLCFTATVLFDGQAIAYAKNDGQGGQTIVWPCVLGEPIREQIRQAAAYAESLPPEVTDYPDPNDDSRRLTIDITLDYLVDPLAETMHAERKIRSAFQRDIGNKVLFVKDGKLLFVKGAKLKAIADKPAYFASLRARQDKPIVILAELRADEAFALWQQHVVKDDPS